MEVLIFRAQKSANKGQIISLDRGLCCIWEVSYVLKLIYGDLEPLDLNLINQKRTVRPRDSIVGTLAVFLSKDCWLLDCLLLFPDELRGCAFLVIFPCDYHPAEFQAAGLVHIQL